MPQYFEIHAINPQRRLLTQAAAILRSGGLIAYPTDSCYAFGWCLGNKSAIDRVRRIRELRDEHFFTLVCRDLSELSTYAKVDNQTYRLLRTLSPGPFTFILRSTREVPRRLQHPSRRTIGLRVPDHPIARELVESLGEPLMSSSLQLAEAELPVATGEAAREALGAQVELVIDGGSCGVELTTVIDLTGDVPTVLRQGRGDAGGLVN